MYLLEKDVEFLSDWLSQDEEIAFLLSNGPEQWIAQKECEILATPAIKTGLRTFELLPKEIAAITPGNFLTGKKFDFQLWHIPSGPLPLLGTASTASGLAPEAYQDEEIENPWLGWIEVRNVENSKIPFFASHPGVLRLEVRLNPTTIIPMSDFQWIGNYYRIIGSPANSLTEKFWKKLRQMATKVGNKIPRENSPGGKPEIFAFPQAYQEILAGRPCALN